MTHSDLESVYEALAGQLDVVGEEKANLYLAKLALLLAMPMFSRTVPRNKKFSCSTTPMFCRK